MYTYTVFDVETPNRANDRMSAIGITVIGKGAGVIDFADTRYAAHQNDDDGEKSQIFLHFSSSSFGVV